MTLTYVAHFSCHPHLHLHQLCTQSDSSALSRSPHFGHTCPDRLTVARIGPVDLPSARKYREFGKPQKIYWMHIPHSCTVPWSPNLGKDAVGKLRRNHGLHNSNFDTPTPQWPSQMRPALPERLRRAYFPRRRWSSPRSSRRRRAPRRRSGERRGKLNCESFCCKNWTITRNFYSFIWFSFQGRNDYMHVSIRSGSALICGLVRVKLYVCILTGEMAT